jgi:diphosphomevalonate decarboxylase
LPNTTHGAKVAGFSVVFTFPFKKSIISWPLVSNVCCFRSSFAPEKEKYLKMYENSKLILESSNPPEAGQFTWRSPSNIALVKYWGKFGDQLPQNPSLSFTLASSFTDTMLEFSFKEDTATDIDLEFFFHQERNDSFEAKVKLFLERLLPVFPFLGQLQLSIHSGNSFPHSAGIASSASSMSALALCLCSLEDHLFGSLSDPAAFDRKASYLARLGSGSACRSIFPYASVWGTTGDVPDSANEYGVAADYLLHDTFKDMHDDILIVSKEEKQVSSRAGHALMEGNPYAQPRYAQARKHLTLLIDALKSGDMPAFGKIVEDEALTLHALMMSSNPSYMLMQPNSLAIIEKVRAYRADTGHQLYFTLDAGPNVHLLYPGAIIHEVRAFIENDLKGYCEDGLYLQDWVGEGPEEV